MQLAVNYLEQQLYRSEVEAELTASQRRGKLELVEFEQVVVPKGTALYIGCFLVLLQAADGILTSIGVGRFGVMAEGNPLLRNLMLEFGCVPTLTMVKVFAILIVIALTFYAQRLSWVKKALGAISCLYLFVAIIPWTYILFFHSVV